MKLKKVFLSISLLFLLLVPINVDAATNEGTIIRLSPEEISIQEKIDLERAQAQSIQPHMDEVVEKWVASGTTDTVWGPFKPAFNQNSEGHIFSQKGSGYFWSDSDKVLSNWSVSVSFGNEYVNLSIGYQPGDKSASGGEIEKCPDNLIGKKTKLFCRRQYRVNRYAIYRKNKYDSGNGTFAGYRYIPTKIAAETKVAAYNAYN